MSTFEHTWQRAKNWALVVLPTDTLPNDRNQINVLKAAVDLEQSIKLNTPIRPIKPLRSDGLTIMSAVMGMANTHLRLQQPEKATTSYLRAINIKPRQADIYNNLAYSLQAQSCYAASLQSIQCAIKLAPRNLEYQDSFRELTNTAPQTAKSTANGKTCPEITCPNK